MSNILENLAPTFQKTIRHINKEIRDAKEPDSNLIKALADLTRAYLSLKGGESDPTLDGDPNYYSNMLREAKAAARPEKRKKLPKKNITLIKRKTS